MRWALMTLFASIALFSAPTRSAQTEITHQEWGDSTPSATMKPWYNPPFFRNEVSTTEVIYSPTIVPVPVSRARQLLCATCVAGKYCSGSTCLACAAGTYKTTTSGTAACTTCTTCAAGTYASIACSATTNRACTACVAGSTFSTTSNAASCTACATACVAGTTYQSTACTTTVNRVCTACTVCAAGTYRSTACTALANTACTSCVAGTTYSTTTNAASCTTCTTCSAGTYASTACTVSVNRACTAWPWTKVLLAILIGISIHQLIMSTINLRFNFYTFVLTKA